MRKEKGCWKRNHQILRNSKGFFSESTKILKQIHTFQKQQGLPAWIADHYFHGRWGADFGVFIYKKLRRWDVWPIENNIDTYDEETLFTIIEFLYDYVSAPKDLHYHSFANCGWHASEYDRDEGKERYREEVNEILGKYKEGYELSPEGEILTIPPTGLEPLVSEIVQTTDPQNIDQRIQTAISKYRKYNATLDEKKDAIRTLADVLEYLKNLGIRLPTRDDSDQ